LNIYIAPKRTIQSRGYSKRVQKAQHNKKHKLTTNIRIQQVGWVLWNPTVLQPGLIRPLVSALSFPRPLDPSCALLISNNLRLPELPQERLVRRAERARAARFTATAPDGVAARVTSIVPRTDTASVEVLRAVGGGRDPLAHDRPKVERGDVGAHGADAGDMRRVGFAEFVFAEDLVDMLVHSYTLEIWSADGHEIVPVAEGLERVVQEDNRVALLGGSVGVSDVAIAVVPILSDHRQSISAQEPCRFVQRRNRSNRRHVLRKHRRDRLHDVVRPRHVIRVCGPLRVGDFVSRVIEPVLTPWCTVKVDDDFDSVVLRPAYGFLEVRQLTTDIGFSTADFKSPVSNRNTDVVKSCSSDGSDIRLRDPTIPMGFESSLSCRLVLQLSKRPFVNDRRVASLLESRLAPFL
jgi:hypothetical protein